jgi:hypothetical protein
VKPAPPALGARVPGRVVSARSAYRSFFERTQALSWVACMKKNDAEERTI